MPKCLLNNKPLLFGIMATSIASGGALYYGNRQTSYKPQTLNNTLGYYGLESNAQKDSLRYLMKEAGVDNTYELLDTKRRTPEQLARSILTFTSSTQDRFTIRTHKQDYWDVATPDWTKDVSKQPLILEALKILKMIGNILPKLEQHDAICVLGTTKPTMVARLNYTENLYNSGELSAKWLVLLVGERYVTTTKNGQLIDGTEEELLELSRKLGKSGKDNNDYSKVTETDLMTEAYKRSGLFNKLETKIIDTPRRDLPRPTTETTVTELCIWLREHPEIKKLTFISNQPYVSYQEAIIQQVFQIQDMGHIQFEVIGAEYDMSAKDENEMAEKLQSAIGALGSTIWAKTPEVLSALGIDISSNHKLMEDMLKLYEKQPLIYKNLDRKYKPK